MKQFNIRKNVTSQLNQYKRRRSC